MKDDKNIENEIEKSVFISYHSSDTYLAHLAKKEIEEIGVKVIMYSPDQKWIYTFGGISKSLETSCLVVYVGKEKFNNLEDAVKKVKSKYVRVELDSAYRLGKKVHFYNGKKDLDVIKSIISESSLKYEDSTHIIVDSTNLHYPDEVEVAYGDVELSDKNFARKMSRTSEFILPMILELFLFIFGLIFFIMFEIILTQFVYRLLV